MSVYESIYYKHGRRRSALFTLLLVYCLVAFFSRRTRMDSITTSVGKAFLLPLDVLLGWIFTNDKRQRIFNRASNTIVIKLAAEEGNITTMSTDVKYIKD